MTKSKPQRVTELRDIITTFLNERLEDKLEKPDLDDAQIDKLRDQFVASAWLEDAARRVNQIQAVTHSLKPIHPDAKGTSIYCPPHDQPPLSVVSSHCLGNDFVFDVVGNAAALDVYKFLELKHQGSTFLDLSLACDTDFAAALSEDPVQAKAWINAFATLFEPRGRKTSHTLAKQIYWPIGDNVHNNDSFHLLAPLCASSLTHHIYQTIQDDRFSEEATTARKAKKEGEYSDHPVREYPQLAIQKLGGTKPLNISQLNSERGGKNLLFASLPPTWRSIDLKPLWGTNSIFPSFSRRPKTRSIVKDLMAFLKSDPTHNIETREQRSAWIDSLIDEFLQFSAELRSLPSGWSQSPECHLTTSEMHWLDPEGVEQDLVSKGLPQIFDTTERISESFANWLNAQLRDPLPMGDPEYLEWRKQMHDQIKTEEREGRHDD